MLAYNCFRDLSLFLIAKSMKERMKNEISNVHLNSKVIYITVSEVSYFISFIVMTILKKRLLL